MKKIKVGKKAVLFKINQTERKFSYHEDMPKIGEILKVVSISEDKVIAYSVTDKNMIEWQFSIDDLVRVKKKSKVENPIKDVTDNLYEMGDIVRITGRTPGSGNSIGDIGVVSSVSNGNGDFKVRVPGKADSGNWTKVEDMERLGLVGSIK